MYTGYMWGCCHTTCSCCSYELQSWTKEELSRYKREGSNLRANFSYQYQGFFISNIFHVSEFMLVFLVWKRGQCMSCACTQQMEQLFQNNLKKACLAVFFLLLFWSWHLNLCRESCVAVCQTESGMWGAQVHLHFSLPASNYAQLHL